jgi:Domain of unknown function DUF11
MRAVTKAGVAFSVALGLTLIPANAVASSDVSFSQTDSPDPVLPGDPVTYTITVTNVGTETVDPVDVDIYSLEVGGSHGVPNPNLSVAPSQGTCAAGAAVTYQEQICSLGSLAPGASAEIVNVAQANVSMDHVAGLIHNVDDNFSNDEAGARTTVIVPPVIEGSKKVKLKGLPAGCLAGDVVVKAKAKGPKVKQIKAKLIGRNVSERLGRASGNKLKFTLPGSELEQARFYELNVNVTRKGAPGLKRSVELQAC